MSKGHEFLAFFLVSFALVATTSSFGAGCACGPKTNVDRKKGETRLDLAKDFLRKGELEAAEREANKALGFDATNEETHNLLGLVDFVQALQNYNLLEIDDCLTGVDAEGLRAQMDRSLLAADAHFAKAIELDAEYGEAWANRGSVALRLDDWRKAAAHLQKALSMPARLQNPAVTRANLGWAFFELNDYPRAAAELRQAKQFQPNMCVAIYRLGRVYFARKEWDKALREFDQVARDEACPIQEAHFYLMQTYAEMGLTANVPTAQRACIELAPHSCVAAECSAPLAVTNPVSTASDGEGTP